MKGTVYISLEFVIKIIRKNSSQVGGTYRNPLSSLGIFLAETKF